MPDFLVRSFAEDAKTWVVHWACCQPKELGYTAEVWSRSGLARHVREHAIEAGYLGGVSSERIHHAYAAEHGSRLRCAQNPNGERASTYFPASGISAVTLQPERAEGRRK
jgi:hypothetical protein